MHQIARAHRAGDTVRLRPQALQGYPGQPQGSPHVPTAAGQAGPNGWGASSGGNGQAVGGNWLSASTRTPVASWLRDGHSYCAARMITR